MECFTSDAVAQVVAIAEAADAYMFRTRTRKEMGDFIFLKPTKPETLPTPEDDPIVPCLASVENGNACIRAREHDTLLHWTAAYCLQAIVLQCYIKVMQRADAAVASLLRHNVANQEYVALWNGRGVEAANAPETRVVLIGETRR